MAHSMHRHAQLLRNLGWIGLVTTTLMFLWTPTVHAAPIFQVGPGGGNPAENLLFNNPNLVLTGTTIQGVTNQTSSVLDISSDVTLVGSGGQATVSQQGGGSFGTGGLTLSPHDVNDLPAGLEPMGAFQDIKFNIDASANGDITFSVITSDAGSPFVFNSTLSGAGQNFFRFTTTGNEVITSVTMTTDENIISVIEQIRVGGAIGLDGGPLPIPEPTTLALFGLAAAGAGFYGYRCRKQPTA